MKTCYYELLGVDKDADAAELKKVIPCFITNSRLTDRCLLSTIQTKIKTPMQKNNFKQSMRLMKC